MEKLYIGAAKLGLRLDQQHLIKFELYYQELIEWNRRINLTTITDYDSVQINHFLDSLTVTLGFSDLTELSQYKIIDVGTGAGLPGIPLKILFRDINLTLLESINKKGEFLKHLVEVLDLDGIAIETNRAETTAHEIEYREMFDVVLCRALAQLPALVELTLPFCKIGGYIIAHKKGDIDQELANSSRALHILGGVLQEVVNIDLDEYQDKRQLVIIKKEFSTPQKYPRRPGLPVKRPISV
jgi:16S rRNA (guanine527-N7)-methyltransferase